VGPPAGFVLEDFRQGQDSSFRVARLSFGNFQNGLIAFVQQTLGHLGYPYALRSRHRVGILALPLVPMFLAGWRGKSDWLSLVLSDQQNLFGRKRNQIAI
jgi:hypothetical protein